jgi:hypothetical protein
LVELQDCGARGQRIAHELGGLPVAERVEVVAEAALQLFIDLRVAPDPLSRAQAAKPELQQLSCPGAGRGSHGWFRIAPAAAKTRRVAQLFFATLW